MASNAQSETQAEAPPDVQVQALCKRFSQGADGTLEVIDQLSFVVRRGALFVIVGPSGCGKTTLLRIISGSEKATSGSVLIDPANASRTAVIEQTPALLPWRTAFQNACLGAELRPRFNSVIASRVLDSFDTFGLKGSEYQFPETLSGGMQQRVAIIRALESRPRILFCDEPFSAIDFVTRLRLSTEFKKMCRVLGFTTLFVTHNVEEAIFLADTVLVLTKRPARIARIIHPQLSRFSEDAVKCRQSPEFAGYFDEIWKALGC